MAVVSNRALDRYLSHENYVGEIACCECGFHRNGKAHPGIKCPRTGRCGECGNDWPCPDHAPPEEVEASKEDTWKREGKNRHALYRERTKLGFIENDGTRWTAIVLSQKLGEIVAERATRREAMAWVEETVKS